MSDRDFGGQPCLLGPLKTRQPRHLKLRDNDNGSCLLGQNLIFLLFVTPKLPIPVNFALYIPATELTV